MRHAARFGIGGEPHIDSARVLERVRAVRERIYRDADSPLALARYNVETLRATARFRDPHTLELNGDGPATLTARRVIIATGSRPRALDLGVATIDPESIWDLAMLPARLLVIGGGPVAVEIAQALSRLGVAVTIAIAGERILTRDEPAAARVIASALQRDGVTILTGRTVVSAVPHDADDGVTATLSDGTSIATDRIFVAVGRVARTAGLGLERAGVAVRDGLIAVDTACRTTSAHIYAAGDCATTARFTHVAERMASVAVMNAVAGVRTRFDRDSLVWTTFTDPELAQVGPTQSELRSAGRRFTVETFAFSRLDRAVIDDAEAGFASIVTTPGGRVIGGTVAGARAGELIAEVALARARRLPLGALTATLHAYPSYALAVRRTADAGLIRRRTPAVLAVLRRLRGLRGTPPPLEALLT
jgi:pyruvate/2-oxoglutarate dehydrogenase complex dihydrolipoamide dehydrogenase (E3) component